MTDTPIHPGEKLISLASAALVAAEGHAQEMPGHLTFRPEWRPTPRTRGQHPQHAGSAQSPPSVHPQHRTQPQIDAVAELRKLNQDVYDKILNHSFPKALGNGTASLDGFRYYMVQDKMYLESCGKLKLIRETGTDDAAFNVQNIKGVQDRLQSSIQSIEELERVCIHMLGIPKSIIEKTPRSADLESSNFFYNASITKLPDDCKLLGYYIILLPCVLSYYDIASRLMNDPSTAKNAIFHSAWTVVNDDRSSVDKYTKFINENIAAKGGVGRADWRAIFRIACQLEAKIFDTGLQPAAPFRPFRIIPDGAYFIPTSSDQTTVLAIQNVLEGRLQPPLDKILGEYLLSNAGSSVVEMKKTGKDNERWIVVATEAGYMFRNLGTNLYLGISAGKNTENFRILRAVSKPYYWWINLAPPKSQPKAGSISTRYQIYDSVNLGYALHADTEILKTVGSTNFPYTPVVAHENAVGAPPLHQMWLFVDQTGQPQGQSVVPEAKSTPGEQSQKDKMRIAELEAESAKYLQERTTLQKEITKLKAESVNYLQERTMLQDDIAKLKAEIQKLRGNTNPAIHPVLPSVATSSWREIPGPALTRISVGSATNVWGVTAAGVVHRYAGDINSNTLGSWLLIPGPAALIDIGAAADGTVWSVTSTGYVFSYIWDNSLANPWARISGSKFTRISAGSRTNVWGVSADKVYRHTGTAWIQTRGPVGSLLTDIGAEADGTVWGINSAGKIYRYSNNTDESHRDPNGWVPIPGLLSVAISAGKRNTVWGIHSEGDVWKFRADLDDRRQSPWVKIDGAMLVDIGVGADGVVWGVSSSGKIFRFQG